MSNHSFRNGCFWGGAIGVSIILMAFVLILVTMCAGIYTIIAAADSASSGEVDLSSGNKFEQYILDASPDSDSADGKKDKIMVLPLHGAITSGSFLGSKANTNVVTDEYVTYALKYIKSQDNVKALIIDVDSPGGGVTPSDCIYHEIKEFKEETKIPVIAMFEGTACSGGYYASMAADTIMALPTCWTGSIGVIMEVPEIEKLMDKAGVSVNTITSLNANGGKSFKDIGSAFRKMRPEERELLQTLVTQSWQRFVGIVAEGRKGKLTPDQVKKLADGRIYNSEQALKHKLIDKIGYKQDLYKLAREKAKAPNAAIVSVTKKESWLDSLGYMCTNITEASGNFNSIMSKSTPGSVSNGACPASPMYVMPDDIIKP
ncbi:signal peptide peptidase SppA [bacterium]|nr:signal peptide peptidase SppA [bacterium]